MNKEFEYEKNKLKNVNKEVKEILREDEELISSLYRNSKRKDIEEERLINVSKKFARLNKTKDKPYFARIDFNNEKIYIGRSGTLDREGKVLITDWRSPIASVYYDSNIGKTSYLAPQGKIDGNLSIKRQIIIENKELINIFDVDTVANDEILKPYLGANADNRLKNIVASIQTEQNNIIRQSINKNLVVQGAAGSGKTTVALHKIAYLVYNHMDTLKMYQFMVIGPNKFFINYISSVLPDLDVEDAAQFTFEELAAKYINEKITINSSSKKLIDFIHGEKIDRDSQIKSSLAYKERIKNYMKKVERDMMLEDLVVDGVTIYTSKQIMNMYYSNTIYDIKTKVANTKSMLIKNIENNLEKYIDKVTLHYNNLPRTTENSNKQYDLKQKIKGLLKKEIKEYFKLNFKVLKVYKEYLMALKNDLFTDTIKKLDKKIVDFEDLAALMYIKNYIDGNEYFKKFAHTVIDEAQDFGEFNFYILKKLMKNSTFAIFGDVAQGIYAYRGISNWKSMIENVFKDNCDLIRLEKSYRTSIEIMEAANNITKFLGLGEAVPVIRHGEKVEYTKKAKEEKVQYVNELLNKYKEKGHKSIAIICKTNEMCKDTFDKLNKINKDVKIFLEDAEKYNGEVCILTSYLAKGLEFDAVIILDADEKIYQSTSKTDMKLLYVAMTRALHNLELIYDESLPSALNI